MKTTTINQVINIINESQFVVDAVTYWNGKRSTPLEKCLEYIMAEYNLTGETGLHYEAFRINVGALINCGYEDMFAFTDMTAIYKPVAEKDWEAYDRGYWMWAKWTNDEQIRWLNDKNAAIQDAYYNSHEDRFSPENCPEAWATRSDAMSVSATREARRKLKNGDLFAFYAHHYVAEGTMSLNEAVEGIVGELFAVPQVGTHFEAVRTLIGADLSGHEYMAENGLTDDWNEECASDAKYLKLHLFNPYGAIFDAWDIDCAERFDERHCPWAWNEELPIPAAA